MHDLHPAAAAPDLTVGCSSDSECTGQGVRCCDRACVAAASCSFAVTGVSPDHGWLTGGDWVTLTGAGFSTAMRVYISEGRAPVRVLDANHALIQTPPGPVGLHDVRITLGGLTATLRNGFRYESGGLKPPWRKIQMARGRGEHPGLAVTQQGHVLVAGGTSSPDVFSTVDQIHPSAPPPNPQICTGNVCPFPKLPTASHGRSVVRLLDGSVLLAGGILITSGGGCPPISWSSCRAM